MAIKRLGTLFRRREVYSNVSHTIPKHGQMQSWACRELCLLCLPRATLFYLPVFFPSIFLPLLIFLPTSSSYCLPAISCFSDKDFEKGAKLAKVNASSFANFAIFCESFLFGCGLAALNHPWLNSLGCSRPTPHPQPTTSKQTNPNFRRKPFAKISVH